MSAADKFLQFPLCELTLPGEPKDVLEAILSYGLTEAGAAVMKTQDTAELKRLCTEYGLSEHQYNSWALAAAIGGRLCGITLGSRDDCLRRHSTLAASLHEWEKRHGTDARVRIRKDVCFEV